MDWWGLLWRYKEYTYNGYTYRYGKYYMRRYNASHTEYCQGEKEISRKEFMKAIADMEYIKPEPVVYETKKVPQFVQLELAF